MQFSTMQPYSTAPLCAQPGGLGNAVYAAIRKVLIEGVIENLYNPRLYPEPDVDIA